MEKLADQQAESEMLRDALDEIASAKDGMNCKECDGAGCKACRGGEAHNGMNGSKRPAATDPAKAGAMVYSRRRNRHQRIRHACSPEGRARQRRR